MSTRIGLATAFLLCAGSVASAQSLSTGFNGTSTLSGTEWNGLFFQVEALNPAGVTITSWDIDSDQAAGMPLDVRVYIKPGAIDRFFHVQDPSLWTLLGEIATTSAGPGNPTPVPIGGLAIPANEVWGIRIGAQPGRLRHKNANQVNAQPIFSNADLQIDLSDGIGQGTLWSTAGTGTIRGWNGTIHYDVGNTGVSGACCLPDGSCVEAVEIVCEAHSGTWQGGGTNCATSPPGGCPQPPPGACCFSDTSCSNLWAGACLAQGGIYHGDNTECGTAPPGGCTRWLSTSFDGGSMASGEGAGAFFTVTALEAQGIVVDRFDVHSNAPAGTPVMWRVYYKPGEHEGVENDWTQWTPLGEVETVAGGLTNRTPVNIGGIHIASGETWSFRMTALSGGMRYHPAASATPVYENSHLRINLGRVQNGYFATLLSANPAEFNGSVHYSLGANLATGACCLPDGSCMDVRANQCAYSRGVFHGDNTACSTTPPGGCPQPPTGACCLPDASCIIVWEGACTSPEWGSATYRGDGTLCDTSCPHVLATAPPTSQGGISVMLDLTPTVPITVSRFDTVLNIGPGLPTTVEIWTTPGSYEPVRTDPTAWTLHDTVEVVSAGLLHQMPIPLNNPLVLAPSETTGVYLILDTGSLRYIGGAAPQTTWFDANLTVYSAHVLGGRWIAAITPNRFSGSIHYHHTLTCYANCDGSTTEPILNVDDFTCFINEFAQAQTLPHEEQIGHYANCDGSTTTPVLTVDDFTCFINAFAQGCP